MILSIINLISVLFLNIINKNISSIIIFDSNSTTTLKELRLICDLVDTLCLRSIDKND